MGNGAAGSEVHPFHDKGEELHYGEIWRLDPDNPDKYSRETRLDKFRVPTGATCPVWAVAVAEVTKILAAATADHKVHLWDLRVQELKVSLEGHSGQIWDLSFSTNEIVLASASSDKTIRIWDADTGHPLSVLRGHHADIRSLSFSFGGDLISGDKDGKMCLWTSGGEDLRALQRTEAHPGGVHAVAFRLLKQKEHANTSAQSVESGNAEQKEEHKPELALSVGADGSVAAWWCSHDEICCAARFAGGDGGGVLSLAVRPGDEPEADVLLAAGNEDGTVWLWTFNPHHGEAEQLVKGYVRLRGHMGSVWAVEFSRDGRLLASGSSDASVRVWEIRDRDGKPIPKLQAMYRGHDSWVRQVRFHKSSHVEGWVTCSTDGTMSFWGAKLQEKQQEGDDDCAALTVCGVVDPLTGTVRGLASRCLPVI